MCETPKDETESEFLSDKKPGVRSYYYDDAHGYEEYDPAADEDDDENEESA
ncbi:MAG: hypothetical protein ABIR33_13195 [Pyrinomonadaceae bacterium]